MSDKVKLIIEIPKPMYESVQNGTYCGTLYEELKNGIPLDDVKVEIQKLRLVGYADSHGKREIASKAVMDVLDNIGKESEVSE